MTASILQYYRLSDSNNNEVTVIVYLKNIRESSIIECG